MKQIVFIISLFTAFSTQSLSQAPQVALKISEKSNGRYLWIALSTKGKDQTLTSENVNAGEYVYFLCRNGNNWTLDEDFVKEDLPRLMITQNEKTFPIEFKGILIEQKDLGLILIGFNKALQLQVPFTFRFPGRDSVYTAEMNIPEEYWPVYGKVHSLFEQGKKSFETKNYKAAIDAFTTFLRDGSAKIFSFYLTAKNNRIEAFEQLLSETNEKFLHLAVDIQTPLKEKIQTIRALLPTFSFVVDSVFNESAGVTAQDVVAKSLVDRASDQKHKVEAQLLSYQRAFEEENTKWIIEGFLLGPNGYKYPTLIEALVHAFTSIDFEDTLGTNLNPTLPDNVQEKLTKFALIDAYPTFFQICRDRLKERKSLFPENFLTNLQKNSAQLIQPYYSILQSISDYFAGKYAEAKFGLLLATRSCYDLELTGRLDILRTLIEAKQKNLSKDIFNLLKQASQLEEKGEVDVALEKYKQVMLVAPDYAPAAFALGKFYDKTGDTYRANNYYTIAITKDPRYLLAYRSMYRNLIKQGNFKPMIDLLTKAIANGNDYLEIRSVLGFAYNSNNQYAEAIKEYEKAIQMNPNSYETNIQIGLVYQNMKSYGKAREYYTKAIQLDPENQTAIEFLKKLDELEKKN